MQSRQGDKHAGRQLACRQAQQDFSSCPQGPAQPQKGGNAAFGVVGWASYELPAGTRQLLSSSRPCCSPLHTHLKVQVGICAKSSKILILHVQAEGLTPPASRATAQINGSRVSRLKASPPLPAGTLLAQCKTQHNLALAALMQAASTAAPGMRQINLQTHSV